MHPTIFVLLSPLTETSQVLLDPGFVLEPQCNNEANELRENGRRFYDDKYRSHFDNLINSAGDWFRGLGEDPLNKRYDRLRCYISSSFAHGCVRFGEDWARLTKDLLFDSEGSLKFKPDLWMDVRKVILPSIIDQVRVPVCKALAVPLTIDT